MTLLLEFLDMRAVALEVFCGFSPLLLIGWLFSLLKWHRSALPLEPGFFTRLFRGALMAFCGLTLFLQGVYLGFLPVGAALGQSLAGLWNGNALIPFGFAAGLAVCTVEPAVSVLGTQVEEATAGTVPRRLLTPILCLGVALAASLSMARLTHGWPITALLLPGYALVLLLSRRCTPAFAAIAYDASTVVTGPMVSTFLMAVALGAAKKLPGRDPLLDGFGLVALIAMVPIIAVMAVGCWHAMRENKKMDG